MIMRFGIDRVSITPDWPTYMAGYGARNDLSDGVNDPLTFSSLILEEKGKMVFIGAVDLVGIGRDHSKLMRQKVAKILGIDFSDVMINCSHTHGGMRVSQSDYIETNSMMPVVTKNKKLLETRICSSAKRALKNLQEGSISYGEGITTVPMNRRLLYKGNVENRPNPEGKTDSALKVLKITDKKGKIAAVITRVSCHAVATGAKHLITADYPGAMRPLIEKAFPGSLAIFWQGVGADARPRQVANGKEWRAMQHKELPVIGECLFTEVMEVLTNRMTPIEKLDLGSALEVVNLPVSDSSITKKDLEKQLKEAKYEITRTCIRKMLAMKELPVDFPMTIQMIRFNRQFSLVGIAAEVLCGLGEKIGKKISTEFSMVLGYTNGAHIYLPCKDELRRGGYETMSVYDLLPSPLSPELEDILTGKTAEFDKKLNRN